MPAIDRGTLNTIADFGEIATLFPASVGVAAALLLQGHRREALAWTVALAACIGVTFVLKSTLGSFSVHVLGRELKAAGFPSGHAALAVAFYGALTLLLYRAHATPWTAVVAFTLGAAIVGAIVWAVWMLKWHHPLDLIAGALLGLASVLLFRWVASGEVDRVTFGGAVVPLAVAGAIVFSLHGVRLKYEAVRGAPALQIVSR